jgi:hypothetical protein
MAYANRGLRIALTLSVRYIWRLLVFLLLYGLAYLFYIFFNFSHVIQIHASFLTVSRTIWGLYLPISILFGVWLWSGKRLLRSVSIKGHLYSCYRRRSTNEYWLATLRGWWSFIWRRSLIYLSLIAMFSGVESAKYFFTINNFGVFVIWCLRGINLATGFSDHVCVFVQNRTSPDREAICVWYHSRRYPAPLRAAEDPPHS